MATIMAKGNFGTVVDVTAKEPVYVRWMIRADMTHTLLIEKGCFEFPWTEEDFVKCLKQRNCIGMVAERQKTFGRIGGFMLYELHKKRMHLLNFAVDPSLHRSGIGRQMISRLVDKLSDERRTSITCEVRESNLPAQLFLKRMGFKATLVLKGFYEETPQEDAYLFRYTRD